MTTFDYTEVAGGGRLELRLAPDASVDAMTWGMLSHNDIPGIARVSRSQLDDSVSLTFGVTGVPLAQLMDHPQRKADVLWLLDAMVDAVLALERHLVPVSMVVYDPGHVYVDTTARTVTMICVPVESADHGDPVTFFKKVIFNLRYDQRDDTTYVSDLINVLGGAEARDLSRLSRLLRANRLTDETPHRPQQAADPAPAPVNGVYAVHGVVPPVAVAPERVAPQPGAFEVPGAPGHVQPPRPARPARPTPAADEDEEQISLFYLLQHYTRENKERYDRQRKARAEAKEAEQAEEAAAAAAPPPAPYAEHAAVPGSAVPEPGAHGAVPGYAPGGGAIPVGVVPESPAGHAPAPEQPAPTVPAAYIGAAPYAADPRNPGPPGQPVPPSPYVLFGLRDDATGVTTWLEKPITVVGRRRARVDVAILDDLVSKQHAILQVDSGLCSIIDNASTNGVEVDGRKIAPLEPTTLRQGSRVRIGEASFTIVEHR